MPLIRHNALHQMAERFEPLHAGFSTADAEDLEISFRNDQLIVSFRDWQNQSVLIAFSETAAFLWTSELDPDGFAPTRRLWSLNQRGSKSRRIAGTR